MTSLAYASRINRYGTMTFGRLDHILAHYIERSYWSRILKGLYLEGVHNSPLSGVNFTLYGFTFREPKSNTIAWKAFWDCKKERVTWILKEGQQRTRSTLNINDQRE